MARTSFTAVKMGQNPAFRAYLGADTEQGARDALCRRCGIQSRAELDTNPDAAERFHAIRREFAYGGGD
ncbi:hypothetical protein WKR98_13370 [Pigmentiphaga sp. YJ18]|uniref:hypothetical protein n=1 Tax=Pigmentiphaga sp. YJ18 TaxID=3134907 RepID=UPI003115C1CC